MNQLPIVLLAKQLKYSLASDKVKTLEKSVEFSQKLQADDPKKTKILNLKHKYDTINAEVSSKFVHFLNKGMAPTQSLNLHDHDNKTEQFYKFLDQKSICEISGGKGSGKTCLLLHFLQQFLEINAHLSQTTQFQIKIFNFTGGMTEARLFKIQQFTNQLPHINVEFSDVSTFEQIHKILSVMVEQQKGKKKDEKKLCVVIDGMTTYLLTKQNSKSLITNLFKFLSEISQYYQAAPIIFTNYVQAKYQLGHHEVYNHGTYFSQVNSSFITHRYYTQRIEHQQHKKWRKQKEDHQSGNKFSHRIISTKGSIITTYLSRIQRCGIASITLQSYRQILDLFEQIKNSPNIEQNQVEEESEGIDGIDEYIKVRGGERQRLSGKGMVKQKIEEQRQEEDEE